MWGIFEVYGKKDDKGNITGSKILEYSQLTELNEFISVQEILWLVLETMILKDMLKNCKIMVIL